MCDTQAGFFVDENVSRTIIEAMATSTKEKFLDTNGAAKALGLSQIRVRQLCQDGRLGTLVGSRYVITAEEIERFKKIPRKPGRPTRDY